MASGDVIFQAINMPVRGDSSEFTAQGTPIQDTDFGAGTSMVPSSGATINGKVTLSLTRQLVGGSLPETLFDSTKLYKLTIEEV